MFRFKIKRQEYYLKFASKNKRALLDYEANAIKQLHMWGLPAPEIHTREDLAVQLDDADQNDGWMLLRGGGKGVGFCLEDNPELMVEAGRLTRHYHSKQFDHFGAIVGGEVCSYDLYAERLLPLCKRLKIHAGQGLVDARMADVAFTEIESYRPTGQAVLCHGELTLPHLLVEKGKVSTAIDWSYMASQPATYDLASMESYCDVHGFCFDDFLNGYGLDKADYLSDPTRNCCRLIYVVRELATLRSKTYSKLRKAFERVIKELN